MKALHLHLSSGEHLAWDLTDADADVMVACVHAWWRDPAGVTGDPWLSLGESGAPDSWVPLAHVVAVQSYPVADPVKENA